MPELEIGSIFAGHRIEGIAGKGGMGVVYRATHLALDHVVAMKVIAAGLAADEVFRERFRSESRIAVSIRHPNVVPIHHAGEEDGLIFVTMDLIDGSDLRKLLNREGKLAPERAIDIVSQTAAALDAAHSKGLVHRDVKPGNILIEERPEGEHVFLTDFGLTKRIEATSGITATGAFVGTLDYVAPEQIKGGRTDARTDVYALGCVLFELLTGQTPFASQEEKVAKIYAHLQEPAPPLLARGRQLPEGLDAVVARALEKEPDQRFPSAGDLARAARAALEYRPVTVAEHTVAVGAAAPDSDPGVDLGETQPAEAPPGPPTEPPAGEDGVDSEGTGATQVAPKPKRERRLPTPAAMFLGLGTIVAAIIAAAAITSGGGSDKSTTTTPTGGATPTGSEPVKDAKLFGKTSIPGQPVNLTFGENQVWVASREAGRITPLDRNGGDALTPISVGNTPEGIATGDGSVWVANAGDGTVERIDPSDGGLIQTITVQTDPRAVAFGDGFIWVANSGSDSISKIDPSGNSIADTYATGGEPHGLLAQGGAVYVVNRTGGTVWKLDATNGQKLAEATVGAGPKAIALADNKLWVTVTDDGNVAQLDPEDLSPTGDPIHLGDEPRGVAAGLGFVWVVEGVKADLARIDPVSAQVTQTLDLESGGADGITTGGGAVWVADGNDNDVARVVQP
jgi:serine/threonine protein kinase/streptogramin lyase